MEKFKYILFGLIWIVFIVMKIIGISEISWLSTLIGVPTVYFNGIICIKNAISEIKEFLEKRKDKINIEALEPIEVNEMDSQIEANIDLNTQIAICNDLIDVYERELEVCKNEEEAKKLKQQLIHNQFVRQDLVEETGYSYQKRKIDKRIRF